MSTASKSTILTVCALLTMLAGFWLSVPEEPSSEIPGEPRASTPAEDVAPQNAEPTDAGASGKYYFDIVRHSAEEFRALLKRAAAIYERTPHAARPDLEIVMVLHGPDIAYFATDSYDVYQDVVDLAAKLDAFGVFDFKVCRVAARNLGIDADQLPAFIEFVPFGPTEIVRLEESGFVRL